MAPNRFGCVNQLTSGRWKARYQIPGTWRQVCRTFDTNRLAERWLRDERARVAAPHAVAGPVAGGQVDVADRSGPVTLNVWSEQWLDELSHLRPSSKARAR